MRLPTLSVVLVSFALAAAGCGKKKDATAPKTGEAASGSDTGSGSSSGSSGSATPAGSDQPAPGGASGGSGASAAPATPTSGKDLVATAKDAGSYGTLLKAIDAAGLTQTLSSGGPYTVFAPTDEAFAKLPAKDLDALLADKAKLAALIQYHVVQGAVSSKDLASVKTEKTVEGASLAIDASSGVKVGTASVVKPDLVASNGVIVGIDTVQIPPQ